MKLFDEGLNWYKGNTHMHTTISEGRLAPEDAIELYRAKGYDFLAITDHRIMSYSRMDGNILLTGGVEFDYMLADQCIHIIGIGMMGEPKLDPPMRGASAQDAIDAINSLDGLAILAHPAWSLNTLAETMPLNGLSAMEIYNSTSGIPWNAARADSSSFVDITYTHGKYTPVVAADDSHTYTGEHTRSFTYVNAKELTLDSIKEAMRAGRMYASQGPRFTQIELTDKALIVDCEPTRRAIFYSNLPWAGQRTFQNADGSPITHVEYPLKRNETYIRVQLDDDNGNSAWSSGFKIENTIG